MVQDPGGTPASRKQTQRNWMLGWGHNVLNYGALGDSDHSTGGGTNDAAAFAAAATAAKAAGGDSYVMVPGGRCYQIATKLTWPTGIALVGLGSYDGGQETPPTLVWKGNNTDPMFDIVSANANIFTTRFINFCAIGK